MSREAAVAVRIRLLPHAAGLPERASTRSAGYDLRAATSEPVRIAPGTRRLIPTGLVLGLPPGYEAQIRPRSGLALRQGLTVLNSPGTIDSDYRGEVKLLLANLGDEPVDVERGERLAQMVVAAVPEIRFQEDDSLGQRPTEGGRNEGGFGSTGT
ncbi:MAG: dUTP diphosphatase [Holophagales bacterium]|nr:dUTP diphosphatase [Holophagales bacterium]MXX60375.1 dUTP diphosphatase [Holophagales bacterium]MYC11581.1 dUTP diphosphatase [Holophagales bacterium]MYD21440.1 dUTP diphosphatase [Holophagales bacterium]MYI32694.1 dUTP diphosphatase [Holophagales bacterium]